MAIRQRIVAMRTPAAEAAPGGSIRRPVSKTTAMTTHDPATAKARGVRIGCRSIVPEDAAALETLLSRGFPERTPAYWRAALVRLGHRPSPSGFPRYGICLTADDAIVGVVLLIHSRPDGRGALVRCCVSSWYVDPAFRVYASLLSKVALRRSDCVYINMSPIASTLEGLPAQGYARYARGQFIGFPALGRPVMHSAITPVSNEVSSPDEPVARLLADHAAMGCIAFYCTEAGRRWPFVFLKRTVKSVPLPCAQLIYCQSLASFVHFQGPIGRYLLWRGLPWAMLDANGPVEDLAGVYLEDRMPKYFKGAEAPRLGDLAYTEAVLFGP